VKASIQIEIMFARLYYRMKLAFNAYQNTDAASPRYNITKKVYDKIKEMTTMPEVPRPSVLPRKRSLKIFPAEHLWTAEFDELLLDGLIRKKVASYSCVRLATLAEAVEDSLPGFTVDQCKERLNL
jgi:hypothetical protein